MNRTPLLWRKLTGRRRAPEHHDPPADPPQPPGTQPSCAQPPVTEPPVTEPAVTEPPVPESPGPPPPAAEEPAPEPPATEPPPAPVRPPGIDQEVAEKVLKIADRISSPELRRRLGEALSALPDVRVIMPPAGTRFDPDLHVWVSDVPAERPELAETVAETLTAGLADREGRVIRPARVTVHSTGQESP